jgi:hypothetical protein
MVVENKLPVDTLTRYLDGVPPVPAVQVSAGNMEIPVALCIGAVCVTTPGAAMIVVNVSTVNALVLFTFFAATFQ